jgi:hypothetical protein
VAAVVAVVAPAKVVPVVRPAVVPVVWAVLLGWAPAPVVAPAVRALRRVAA